MLTKPNNMPKHILIVFIKWLKNRSETVLKCIILPIKFNSFNTLSTKMSIV